MAKFTVVKRPSGLLNGADWPEKGEQVDLPESVGGSMAAAGWLKAVERKARTVEKRPASTAGVETRAAKPAAKKAPAKKA